MYESFYNLKRSPFDITPDPSFLFPTKRHNEALAALYYGIRRHKGFGVLTGEVGTGKTLLLRCLLQLFKQSKDVTHAYVFNSRLSPMEFLGYVASDFGLSAAGKNKSEILLELCRYVVSRGLRKLTTALIVDEAHHLSTDTLEEVRLLTNLETTTEKLLQIVLVGQPELDEKLDSIGLRQLKQRIALRSHLEPLTANETKEYIVRRLLVAGANSSVAVLFPAEAMVAVYRHSRGTPRVINTICENALVAAYAKQMRSVTPAIIEDVVEDLRLDVVSSPEVDKYRELDGSDVQRAARTLLELYASLQKSTARGHEWREAAGVRLP